MLICRLRASTRLCAEFLGVFCVRARERYRLRRLGLDDRVLIRMRVGARISFGIGSRLVGRILGLRPVGGRRILLRWLRIG